MYDKSLRGGFVLAELLIVIAIFGILTAIIVVAVMSANRSAHLARVKVHAAQVNRYIEADCVSKIDITDSAPLDSCAGASVTTYGNPQVVEGFDGKKAWHFTGNEYVEVSDVPALGDSWTIASWFKPDDVATLNGAVISAVGNSGSYYHIFVAGKTVYAYMITPLLDIQLTGLDVLSADDWNHIAFTYDNTKKLASLVVNGELVDQVLKSDTAALKQSSLALSRQEGRVAGIMDEAGFDRIVIGNYASSYPVEGLVMGVIESNVSVPTAVISTSPTAQPTDSPTPTPTITPTDSPVYSPTYTPTDSPTWSPTPSETPTITPTWTPTLTPTPTSSWTPTPTITPTTSPT
ncbi:MAG: LamG-like jellyroll fold domain-containing protein [bacterium]|nr:LamG-like jellyroll fold domain-containing protein [bacterium]MDZ4342241.1 LamG-like jellyroll fold domain-containing protein [Candidatus Binatia bacterium]